MKIKTRVTGTSVRHCISQARQQVIQVANGLKLTEMPARLEDIEIHKVSIHRYKGVGSMSDEYAGSVTFKW